VETIRVFIAVSFNQKLIIEFKKLQDQFKQLDLNASWVKPENIHLTLKFLGEVEINQVSQIFDPLHKTALAFSSFNLRLSSLGIFPNWNRPRIFWIGLEDKEEIFKKLKKRLELELFNVGFPRDMKSFSPHLTLARLRSASNKNLLKKEIEKLSVPLDHLIKVSEIKLFQSSLTPEGTEYAKLFSCSLKN
jgi:2'-5' RNA ligase